MLYYCCWSIIYIYIYIYIFGCMFVLRNKSLCFFECSDTLKKDLWQKKYQRIKICPFYKIILWYILYTIYILIFLSFFSSYLLMNDFNLIMYINFDVLYVCILSTLYILPQYLWMMILDTFTMWNKKFHVESLMAYWLI